MMLQIVMSLTDDSRGIIYNHKIFIVQAGKPYLRGRISTFGLLVLTIFKLAALHTEAIIFRFYKQPTLMRRSTVLSLPLQ